MTQVMTSQKIKRTCDACGAEKEWELVGLTDEIIAEMQNWYTVIREVFNGERFVKTMVQSCSLACVPAAAVKLALPKVQERPEIDLESLRANSGEIIN